MDREELGMDDKAILAAYRAAENLVKTLGAVHCRVTIELPSGIGRYVLEVTDMSKTEADTPEGSTNG